MGHTNSFAYELERLKIELEFNQEMKFFIRRRPSPKFYGYRVEPCYVRTTGAQVEEAEAWILQDVRSTGSYLCANG
jgi:hypothetical protein